MATQDFCLSPERLGKLVGYCDIFKRAVDHEMHQFRNMIFQKADVFFKEVLESVQKDVPKMVKEEFERRLLSCEQKPIHKKQNVSIPANNQQLHCVASDLPCQDTVSVCAKPQSPPNVEPNIIGQSCGASNSAAPAPDCKQQQPDEEGLAITSKLRNIQLNEEQEQRQAQFNSFLNDVILEAMKDDPTQQRVIVIRPYGPPAIPNEDDEDDDDDDDSTDEFEYEDDEDDEVSHQRCHCLDCRNSRNDRKERLLKLKNKATDGHQQPHDQQQSQVPPAQSSLPEDAHQQQPCTSGSSGTSCSKMFNGVLVQVGGQQQQQPQTNVTEIRKRKMKVPDTHDEPSRPAPSSSSNSESSFYSSTSTLTAAESQTEGYQARDEEPSAMQFGPIELPLIYPNDPIAASVEPPNILQPISTIEPLDGQVGPVGGSNSDLVVMNQLNPYELSNQIPIGINQPLILSPPISTTNQQQSLTGPYPTGAPIALPISAPSPGVTNSVQLSQFGLNSPPPVGLPMPCPAQLRGQLASTSGTAPAASTAQGIVCSKKPNVIICDKVNCGATFPTHAKLKHHTRMVHFRQSEQNAQNQGDGGPGSSFNGGN